MFGGFASESWEVNPKYYGTGESFVFRVYDPDRVFDGSNVWQRENMPRKTQRFPETGRESGASGRAGNATIGSSDERRRSEAAQSRDGKGFAKGVVQVGAFRATCH